MRDKFQKLDARDQYFKATLNLKKGISGTGVLLGEIIERYDRPLTQLEPGDIALEGLNKDIDRHHYAPIAYDLWYLFNFVNIFSRTTEKYDYVPDKDLPNDVFDFLNEKLEGLRPVTFIRDIESLISPTSLNWLWKCETIPKQWLDLREYFINLTAYETWHPKIAAQYDSAGPDKKHGFIRDECVGYMAFPVGQIGVMEVLSILKQTETEVDDFLLPDEELPETESICDYLFPPIDQYTGQNQCFGEHFFESGYYIPVEKRKNVEWLEVAAIPEADYADIRPQFWMRYWIHRDETFPVPGEFIGIIAKPLALPPHLWWFQETSPFVHAGNWIETTALTSGVVTGKTAETARIDSGVGAEYKVKVHGWEIYVYASDFLEYEIGDRVALLKISGVTVAAVGTSFTWRDMYTMEEMDKHRKTYNYIIIPLEFYKVEKEITP